MIIFSEKTREFDAFKNLFVCLARNVDDSEVGLERLVVMLPATETSVDSDMKHNASEKGGGGGCWAQSGAAI